MYCCSNSIGGMKLIVILAFVSFASAHPVNLTGLAGHHHPHFTVDEHVLFHLSKMLLDWNASDIPENITKLPIPQLTSCITAEQRGLIKACATRAKCSLKTGKPMKEIRDCKESSEDISSEEHLSPAMHHNDHLEIPMTMECITETITPMGMDVEVNLTNLELGIIHTTSLSVLQKNNARIDFKSCMSSNMTTIPYVYSKKESGKTTSIDQVNKANSKAMKAMLCISKAVILNGCANVPRTTAKLQMSPQSSEHPTEEMHDKAEMVVHPHPHPHPHDHDFLDLLAEIVMEIKFKGDMDKINSFEPSELLNCIPQEQREAIHKTCEEKIVDEHDHMMADMTVAECVMVDLVKALNNVTGILDVKVVETAIIEKANTLSADQKKAAFTTAESCIESNFTLAPPPHIVKEMHEGKMSDLYTKYDKRNNPMRAMVCIVKALIENGCSSTSIQKRSITMISLTSDESSSSEEKLNNDGTDDS